MTSERNSSAKTELRAATRSLMSSLDRGRNHLTRCLDALRNGSHLRDSLLCDASSNRKKSNWEENKSYDRRTANTRARYSVQEGDHHWGGRILNPCSGSEYVSRSPSWTSPLPRRRKRQKGASREETGTFVFKSKEKYVSPNAPQRTVPCRCFAIMPPASDSEPFPSPVLPALTGTEDTLSRDEQIPKTLSASSPDLYIRNSPLYTLADGGLLERLRSRDNVRRKSVSYVRGPPSFASAVPDLTSSEDDDNATAAPDSDWTASGGDSVRSPSLHSEASTFPGRGVGSDGTVAGGSGVLPADDFWSTRPRTLLGYDFIAGCLDNDKDLEGRGALDWTETRMDRLLKDWNPPAGRKSRGSARRSSSLPRESSKEDSFCLHRYRLESELESAGRRSPARSVDRLGSDSSAISDEKCSEADDEISKPSGCRLCRLLVQEKAKRSPCYHSCRTDVAPEGVPKGSSKILGRASSKSDMTFWPESLALSQNCSLRGTSGSTMGARASSVPRKTTRTTARWRV